MVFLKLIKLGSPWVVIKSNQGTSVVSFPWINSVIPDTYRLKTTQNGGTINLKKKQNKQNRDVTLRNECSLASSGFMPSLATPLWAVRFRNMKTPFCDNYYYAFMHLWGYSVGVCVSWYFAGAMKIALTHHQMIHCALAILNGMSWHKKENGPSWNFKCIPAKGISKNKRGHRHSQSLDLKSEICGCLSGGHPIQLLMHLLLLLLFAFKDVFFLGLTKSESR